MPSRAAGPLTDADYEKLNKALQALATSEHETSVARQAGFDCAAEDEACKHFKQRLMQIKAAYFPDRP